MPCGSGFGKRSQNKRPRKYSKTSTPKLLSEAHFDRYDLCTTHTGSQPWRGRQGTDKGNSQPFRGSGKDFFDRSILGRDVAVNLVPVGVVVGQGRVNLRERKVLDFGGDLLGSQTEVVPAGNAPDRDAGTGDAGPALADFWRPLDQCSNIDNGGHFLRSILLARRRPAQRFRRRPELLSRRLLSRVCLSAGRRREAAPSQPATWLLPPGYGRVGYESIRRADPRYAVTFRCRWLPSPSSTARLGQGLRRAAGRRRCVPAPLQLGPIAATDRPMSRAWASLKRAVEKRTLRVESRYRAGPGRRHELPTRHAECVRHITRPAHRRPLRFRLNRRGQLYLATRPPSRRRWRATKQRPLPSGCGSEQTIGSDFDRHFAPVYVVL